MAKSNPQFGVLAAAVLALAAGPSWAQTPGPLIAGYGKVAPVETPGERPDPALDYKVVINVTKAGEAGAPPPYLDKAARLANLLAAAGVPAEHRHIVAVLSGGATTAVLTEAGTKAHGLGPNPSVELIARLIAAGVRVDVCGQAMAGAGIAPHEVLPGIQIDLSALTTLSNLQLRGYALLPD